MKYERTFKLALNREVQIVVSGQKAKTRKEITIELDFFVKDMSDKDFRPLIGIDHPQYWKFKKYTAEKSQYLQLEYSGVSRSQLNKAIKEFKSKFESDFTFAFRTDVGRRIKYLKGIRVPAQNIRKLSLLE
jgi:hypothetical protein